MKQLEFADSYPEHFPQTTKEAEPHEETQAEGRERDGAAAASLQEKQLVGNQVWKMYGILRDQMEHSDYDNARKTVFALYQVLDDLKKISQ